MSDNTFNRAGLASLGDLATHRWKTLFAELEAIQHQFLNAEPHCQDYPWPRDPLHNCIRVWEYPFVYHHLKSSCSSSSANQNPVVVDLGSGATFFPFAVARLGRSVIAVDADERAVSSMKSAIEKVAAGIGSVTALNSDGRSIKLEDRSVDLVYCISVLEHIPDFERVISEVGRILRPGGEFILTFDVDLRGNFELGPESYTKLMTALEQDFSLMFPISFVHPLSVLTSDNSLYPMYPPRSSLKSMTYVVKDIARGAYNLIRGRPNPPARILASTFGLTLTKRY